MSRRRSLLLVVTLMGSLVVGYAVVGMGPWLAGMPRIAQAAVLPGFGSLSGSVESGTPFKAAQVFIRNVDKRMLYMVYTNAGQFRAAPLFPGTYQVSAGTKGLESDVQTLVLKAGDSPRLKLALHAAAGTSQRTIVNARQPT